MKTIGPILALTLLAVAAPAHAGLRVTRDVLINNTAHTMSGGYGDARATADTRQYLNCETNRVVGRAPWSRCTAQNATDSAVCYTNNANLIRAIEAARTGSVVTIQFDAGGTCRSVLVQFGSPFTTEAY